MLIENKLNSTAIRSGNNAKLCFFVHLSYLLKIVDLFLVDKVMNVKALKRRKYKTSGVSGDFHRLYLQFRLYYKLKTDFNTFFLEKKST